MILLLCPLKKERELLELALKNTLKLEKTLQFNGLGGLSFFNNNRVALGTGSLGFEKMKLKTRQWLNLLSTVEHLIIVGSSGSLSPSLLKKGDVVLVTSVISKNSQDQLIRQPLNTAFLNKTDTPSKAELHYSFHMADVFKSHEAIDSSEKRELLFKNTDTDLVTMESGAPIEVAKEFDITYSELRGITDLADLNLNHDFEKNLSTAIENCADFLSFHFLG